MTNTVEQITVGTIYASQWGVDCSQTDFYEVVRSTPKTVELREIARAHVDGGSAVTPIQGQYTGEPFRRRFAKGSAHAVNINEVAYATPWNGTAASVNAR